MKKTAEPSNAYCLLPGRSRSLAVSLDAVVGLVEAGRIIRLPLCPTPVVGLCMSRGGFMPVLRPIECADADDRRALEADRAETILVLRTPRGDIGLLIRREGVSIAENCVVRTTEPRTLPMGFIASGSIERDGATLAVIDPARSWQGVRTLLDGWYAAVTHEDQSTSAAEVSRC
jgi:CheW-like domain